MVRGYLRKYWCPIPSCYSYACIQIRAKITVAGIFYFHNPVGTREKVALKPSEVCPKETRNAKPRSAA